MQGARFDIANANGLTAKDLILHLGSGAAQDELRSLIKN